MTGTGPAVMMDVPGDIELAFIGKTRWPSINHPYCNFVPK
jgi:hypothetical protein